MLEMPRSDYGVQILRSSFGNVQVELSGRRADFSGCGVRVSMR